MKKQQYAGKNSASVDTYDVTTRSDSYTLLYPTLRFPLPHAIEAEVEILDGEEDILGFALFAGPVGGENVVQGYAGGILRYVPSQQLVI